MRRDPAARFYMDSFGKNKTRSTRGTRAKMHEMPIVRHAIGRGILAHRRQHDPVARCHASERDRLEQFGFRVALQDAAFVFAAQPRVDLVLGIGHCRSPVNAGSRERTVDSKAESHPFGATNIAAPGKTGCDDLKGTVIAQPSAMLIMEGLRSIAAFNLSKFASTSAIIGGTIGSVGATRAST